MKLLADHNKYGFPVLCVQAESHDELCNLRKLLDDLAYEYEPEPGLRGELNWCSIGDFDETGYLARLNIHVYDPLRKNPPCAS